MNNNPKEEGNSIIQIIHNASRGGNTIVKKGGKLKEGNNNTISLRKLGETQLLRYFPKEENSILCMNMKKKSISRIIHTIICSRTIPDEALSLKNYASTIISCLYCP